MRVFPLAVLIVFTVFVTVFASSADKNEVRGLPRWVWVLLCIAVTPLGGILYLIFGRPLPGGPSAGQGTSTKPVAPDDDAEFLRRLEDEIRRDRDDKND